MIEFLKRIALRDRFICDRCGTPDLMIGMYADCATCKKPLIKQNISDVDRIRLYSIKIIDKFIHDHDQFINDDVKKLVRFYSAENSGLATGTAMVCNGVKSILTEYGGIGGEKVGGLVTYDHDNISLLLDESYVGDMYERGVIFSAVAGSLRDIIQYEIPRDAYKTYPDALMDWIANADNPSYKKRKALVSYFTLLCNELNKHSFLHETKIGGKIIRSEYEVDEAYPEDTFLGMISENLKGYEHLKKLNLLQNDICHLCGEYLPRVQYSFTEPKNQITLPICKNCHSKGR